MKRAKQRLWLIVRNDGKNKSSESIKFIVKANKIKKNVKFVTISAKKTQNNSLESAMHNERMCWIYHTESWSCKERLKSRQNGVKFYKNATRASVKCCYVVKINDSVFESTSPKPPTILCCIFFQCLLYTIIVKYTLIIQYISRH